MDSRSLLHMNKLIEAELPLYEEALCRYLLDDRTRGVKDILNQPSLITNLLYSDALSEQERAEIEDYGTSKATAFLYYRAIMHERELEIARNANFHRKYARLSLQDAP